jgi:hypothetical protein
MEGGEFILRASAFSGADASAEAGPGRFRGQGVARSRDAGIVPAEAIWPDQAATKAEVWLRRADHEHDPGCSGR